MFNRNGFSASRTPATCRQHRRTKRKDDVRKWKTIKESYKAVLYRDQKSNGIDKTQKHSTLSSLLVSATVANVLKNKLSKYLTSKKKT